MDSTAYRSVPPRHLNYTFSDIVQTSLDKPPTHCPRAQRARSRTTPVSTNAPQDFAERFKSRPTTRPAVVDFNSASFNRTSKEPSPSKPRFSHYGFSAAKMRSVLPPTGIVKLKPSTDSSAERASTANNADLHLAPLPKGAEPDCATPVQTRACRPPPPLHFHNSTKTPDRTSHKSPTSSSPQQHSRAAADSSLGMQCPAHGCNWAESKLTHASQDLTTGDPWCLPDALLQCRHSYDLSDLPKPKRIHARRDVPWVFRFKVKREMNALSRIMASKPVTASPLPST